MRLIIIIAFLVLAVPFVQGQLGDYMITGTSLTYVRFLDENFPPSYRGTSELSWTVNTGIGLSEKTFIGLQVINIFAGEIKEKKDYYSIYGTFFQYRFYKRKRHQFIGETSINRGNYCFCENENAIPEKVPGLWYGGIGFVYEYALKTNERISFDLAAMNYAVLNFLPEIDFNYTRYTIGVNYRLN